MPTLFRFLTVLVMIAAVIYGSMVALSVLVVPRQRDVTVRIPSEKLNPPRPTGIVPVVPQTQAATPASQPASQPQP